MLWAIGREMAMRAPSFSKFSVETVYFGGGTPSLLSASEINRLLATVAKHYTLVPKAEITLEANPDDLDDKTLSILAQSSVNRLSIGVQSFFDEDLQMMNRTHTASQAEQCVKSALSHFENLSIDLMYGVPGMSDSRWKQNVKKAFALGVPHFSSYALTVEKNTALAHFIKNKDYPPLDESLALSHFEILVCEAEKQGYVQYEIANFGKPDFFSKHNTSYWKEVPYLGIGPSAHSFLGAHRSWNVAHNARYMKAIESGQLAMETEVLSLKDRYNEYVMTGLRTIEGVSFERVSKHFGKAFVDLLDCASKPFLSAGTLELKNGILKTTKEGKFLVDGIASELFCLEED